MTKAKSHVLAAFGSLLAVGLIMGVISCVVNLLALTGSFYMMQVYDRVLSSRSIPTLIALSVLAAGLYLFQGALEVMRTQLLVRLGGRVERRLIRRAHDASLRLPLMGRKGAEAQQPIRDVDTIRSFLSGQGPVALLDLPWMPVYIGFIFLLHPILGWVTLAGAVVLIFLTLLTEWLTRAPSEAMVKAAVRRLTIAETSSRNAEVLQAMGFAHRAQSRFVKANSEYAGAQEKLTDLTSGFSSISRVFRLVLQSGLLGIGAYLVIRGDMSAGAIIACSIASSRAYAPIETVIANWKGFIAARQSKTRLDATFAALPPHEVPIDLPAPVKSLKVENLSVAVPGTQRLVVNGISFEMQAGHALAVIGPSASGKSSLARALVGVWSAARGTVRLDGASLEHWSPERLGVHVGYLPQDVELFDGTLRDNIARFEPEPDSRKVLAAAQAAGVHEMILRLPDGYETELGDRGQSLSAGQRQRVALARALYGDPFLVVLDEPNSNLDADGEEALAKAIDSVRARGGIPIVVAHRPGILAAVDHIAVIGNGQLTAFGPRDEILKKAVRPAAATAAAPTQITSGARPAALAKPA